MTTSLSVITAFIFCTVVALTAFAASKRYETGWAYYHFDGKSFIAGQLPEGYVTVAVRDRVQPEITTKTANKIEVIALPQGKGAIAGICYIQISGGKLRDGSGFIALPNAAILVTGTGGSMKISSNGAGYFMTVLAAGEYEVTSGPARSLINVEEGKTTFSALRTGKRMVD